MASNAVDTVFDSLASMTVLELVELKKRIEYEWGTTAAAPRRSPRQERSLRAAARGGRRRRRGQVAK